LILCNRAESKPQPVLQVDIPPPQDPNEVEAGAQKRAGDEAYARGDYGAALEAYTASLRHDTSDTKVWANRAAAALKLAEFELAVADCKKARTLKPDNIKV
jgi:tetratricopeptide (TPR) repeat protein